jgi:hypothetical protein
MISSAHDGKVGTARMRALADVQLRGVDMSDASSGDHSLRVHGEYACGGSVGGSGKGWEGCDERARKCCSMIERAMSLFASRRSNMRFLYWGRSLGTLWSMKVLSCASSMSFGGSWVMEYSPDSAMGTGV